MGTLYLVSTPIGNLDDITLRALRVLGSVDLIAAEDTRHTGRLLKAHSIDTPLISYHEHNKGDRLVELVQRLQQGSIALVCDAGTPALSDPGFELVRRAVEQGHTVSPIPGPSAPIAALVASGLPTDSCLFLGYLPRKPKQRRQLLERVAAQPATLIAFEAPHRLLDSLADLQAALGAERRIAVCRELTKLHEQIHRGTLAEVRAEFEAQQPRGEITLVIAGGEPESEWDEDSVREAMSQRISQGERRSEAAREVAAAAGWPRRAVYRLMEGEE